MIVLVATETTVDSAICLGGGVGRAIRGIAGNFWRSKQIGMDIVSRCGLRTTLGRLAGFLSQSDRSGVHQELEHSSQYLGLVPKPPQISPYVGLTERGQPLPLNPVQD